MDREERIVMLKLDVIFKRVFGNDKNTTVLAALLSDLLEIPRESIRKIFINNVELAPEYPEQKFSRLDLKLDVDGTIINIEMQVNYEPYFRDRTLFYWSKLYSDELDAGEEYTELKQTICINIINFNLFDCDDYHSHFKVMESDRHEVLTDKFAIHFFELKKLGKCKRNKRMEDWLNLINAETEDDLMAIQQTTQIPEVQETIVMLRQLSADEQVRQEAFYREKRLHDEASALGHARREGKAEGRAEGIVEGIAIGEAKGIAIGEAKGIAIGEAKGEVKGKSSMIKMLIQKGNTISEIAEFYGITEDEIEKILSQG